MSSFPSDFQGLVKHKFPLYFLYELFTSLRMNINRLTLQRNKEFMFIFIYGFVKLMCNL